MTDSARTLVVVVTGVSGAGKSTAVHALEDLGYFCVDNLPTPVMKSTLEAFAAVGVRRIALGIDVRVRGFLDEAAAALELLSVPGERELSVLFLDASDEALLRRFSSTRRPHPLSTTLEPGSEQAATAVLDGIRIERERLTPLRARATMVLDTTRLSVHELRRHVTAQFGPGAGRAPRLHTRLVSFGFKFGTPVDADLLFDVRFLDNPHFVPELRDLPIESFAISIRTRAIVTRSSRAPEIRGTVLHRLVNWPVPVTLAASTTLRDLFGQLVSDLVQIASEVPTGERLLIRSAGVAHMSTISGRRRVTSTERR